jgi:hypothetical protein
MSLLFKDVLAAYFSVAYLYGKLEILKRVGSINQLSLPLFMSVDRQIRIFRKTGSHSQKG